MKRPFKILISGYYGFNNIGDDSILIAVLDSLRNRLHDVEITVLAQNPEIISMKHGVRSANRKSLAAIMREVGRTNLLISGGGSLLQDVTSKRSILYYLAIMWLSLLMGKKIFIYSQGIGPINSANNRRITAWTLKRAAAIVVRDEASKELLELIGIPEKKVHVTADPVLRVKAADLAAGKKILELEGFNAGQGDVLVGMAIREPRTHSDFVEELCSCIKRLTAEYGAKVVLIPFHFAEDMSVIQEIDRRVSGSVVVVRHKYLTEEMLSIIGNMDILVGVRLHSLIYAAVMNVPMIAVSYDPKVNAFMHSLQMKAMSFVSDFRAEDFMEEFKKTIANSASIKTKISANVNKLVKELDKNENIIQEIINKHKK